MMAVIAHFIYVHTKKVDQKCMVLSQHVSTNNTILDKDDFDGHGTDPDGSRPSWQDTFSLDLIDSATEDEVILAGNYVNVVVDWAIDSMHGKAKFMMEECTITQGSGSHIFWLSNPK